VRGKHSARAQIRPRQLFSSATEGWSVGTGEEHDCSMHMFCVGGAGLCCFFGLSVAGSYPFPSSRLYLVARWTLFSEVELSSCPCAAPHCVALRLCRFHGVACPGLLVLRVPCLIVIYFRY